MAEKFGIIASLEPLKKGDEFEQFPVHVTLMTWFSMPRERVFMNKLQNFAYTYGPQEIAGGDEAMFGKEADIRVRKLGRSGALYAMHADLLAMIRGLDGEVWSGGFVGDDYIPHVTYQEGRGLSEGEAVTLSRIQLISGDETGPRRVVADFGLVKDRDD